MKSLFNLKTLSLLPTLFAIFTSCKKEVASNAPPPSINTVETAGWHLYKDTASMSYKKIVISRRRETFPLIRRAWYRCNGTGSSNLMSQTKIVSNEYVSFDAEGTTSIAAPLMDQLPAIYNSETYPAIPATVSCVINDDAGNSLWLHLVGSVFTQTSFTRSTFYGSSTVVGGTGKFAGAHGELTTRGYFNLDDESDAAIGHSGKIWY